MAHVAFVPLTGLRVQAEEVLELGMNLPGLRKRADALSGIPALGLLTLAGMTPPPWTCSYHARAVPDAELVEEVLENRPSLVALSALTASIEQAYRLGDDFRRHGIPVVLGGLHATTCSEEAAGHCDAVVVGEGEPVWRDVLQDVQQRSLRSRYQATAAFDLSMAPMPRFDLIKGCSPPRWTLQTERGCPFACEFCGASRLLGPFREKPVERIRQELSEIRQYARRPWLELADDNSFAGGRDTDEWFAVIAESNARYFTETDWRIGERPDVLKRLAASGCVQVLVGIESLVFRYPGMGQKHAQLQRMMDAVQAIQEAGVVVNGCFIVGADGETDASLDRLIEFLLACPLAELQITLQTPFPGTRLYSSLKQQGRLLEQCGWSHYTLFDVTYHPDSMTADALAKGFQRVLRAVFETNASERRTERRKAIWRSTPESDRFPCDS